MKNWKNLFAIHILERGLDYYEEGVVMQVTAIKNGFRASVEGAEDYKVKIETKNGKISNMQCSCPYAADGNYCKHMAAVLYEIENEELEDADESDGASSDSGQDLLHVIRDIPEPEVRALLFELAEADVHLKNRILTQYSKTVSAQQMLRLRKEVERIAYQYSDRYGFVDWRNCYSYIREMSRFLTDHVSPLLKKKCFMQAFELVNTVFVTVGNQDMDDSDGESAQLAEECYEYWQAILENCGQKEQEQMFEWFEKNRSAGIVVDYIEEYIDRFLMNEFQEEAFLRKKLAMLKRQMEEDEPAGNDRSSSSVYYQYEDNVAAQLDLMKKLHYTDEEIQTYIEKYWGLAAIRKMQLEECVKGGRQREAVAILVESKELDRHYPGFVAQYSEKLVALYQQMNMKTEYKEELIFYIFHCTQKNLDYMKQLKAVCTKEEWERYREQLLDRKSGWSLRYALMEQEGLYERLFKEISASGAVYTLNQYEKALKAVMPEQVRDFYVNYVKKQAEHVSDRNGYRLLMQYLKKIKQYPGGSEAANEIAAGWRAAYRRRTAMMDEMRKAGF